MTSPDPDRLRYAQIAGAVARHALGWRLTADEEAVAVAELTEAAAGRADLLAERAGTALGFGEGRPDAARYRQIAELCIAAGADPALIEGWIKVGRERAATAAAIPYTGLPPGGLLLLVAGFDERGRGRADVLPLPDGRAHLARAAGHLIEDVAPGAWPVGVDRRVRAVPLQTSPSVLEKVWPLVCDCPTAVQESAEAHDTPLRRLRRSESPYRGNGARDRFTSMGRGSANG